MKKYLIFFLTFCVAFSIQAQKDSLTTVAFPMSWQGTYQGDLEIFSGKGLQQTIPMELDIQPIDSSDNWTWAITYGLDKEKSRRGYELITVDSTTGQFQIDEKNSIVLDGQLMGNVFISRFEVMGNLLTSLYEKQDSTIFFTILMGKVDNKKETGGGIINGDTIPVVYSYQPGVLQKARLEKIK